MMRLPVLGVLALLLWSSAGFAAAPPEAGDPRFQVVHYVPEQVIELRGTVGFVTTIQFGDGERMENIAIGNSLGWQITPNKRANLLFVKPFQKHPTTNMTVITNLRRYDFHLRAEEPSPRAAAHPPVFGIRFAYPAPEVPEAVVVLQPSPPSVPAPPRAENSRYTYQGSRELIPARVFDDGQFTYFEFAKDADYPAIYFVGVDRKESLVNFSVSQGFIVVDKLSPGFVLRRGTLEAKIFNDGFKGPAVSALIPRSKSKSLF